MPTEIKRPRRGKNTPRSRDHSRSRRHAAAAGPGTDARVSPAMGRIGQNQNNQNRRRQHHNPNNNNPNHNGQKRTGTLSPKHPANRNPSPTRKRKAEKPPLPHPNCHNLRVDSTPGLPVSSLVYKNPRAESLMVAQLMRDGRADGSQEMIIKQRKTITPGMVYGGSGIGIGFQPKQEPPTQQPKLRYKPSPPKLAVVAMNETLPKEKIYFRAWPQPQLQPPLAKNVWNQAARNKNTPDKMAVPTIADPAALMTPAGRGGGAGKSPYLTVGGKPEPQRTAATAAEMLMSMLAGIYNDWPPQLPKEDVPRNVEYAWKLPCHFREDPRPTNRTSKVDQLPDEWKDLIRRHGYQVERMMDECPGRFTVVYEAWRLAENGQKCQRVSIKFFIRRDESMVRELEICSRLKHRFIMQMYEVLDLDPFTAMIYEYGDMDAAECIRAAERRPSSTKAKLFMAQMADALEFMHFNGVAHQDLTMYNTYLCGSMSPSTAVVKLWGFSYAELSPPLKLFLLMRRLQYSPEVIAEKVNRATNESFQLSYGGSNRSFPYKAPEVVATGDQRYKPYPADVFSLGVCYFLWMFNEFPFRRCWNVGGGELNYRPCKEDIDRYRRAVAAGEWSVSREQIARQSTHLEALLEVMLWADPVHRIPSDQILYHPYFRCDERVKQMLVDTTLFGNQQRDDEQQCINPIWNCDPNRTGKIGVLYI